MNNKNSVCKQILSLIPMVLLFPGEVGAGSAAVAVAAAHAAIATLPMQPGRRGTGTLKAPYAAALGKILRRFSYNNSNTTKHKVQSVKNGAVHLVCI